MHILSSARNREFRCPRCGNSFFPGGTEGLMVLCPVVGCQCAINPANMPLTLPDPAASSFTSGITTGSRDPLLYDHDAQGEMIVSGVEGSPTTISIPAMVNGRPVMAIGPRAFANQTQLRRVTLPDAVVTIGEEAFDGCLELESVTFGKGLRLLDRGCFRGCAILDEVTLPSKVEEIGRDAFAGCSMLEEVTLTGPVEVIRDSAFALCSSLSRFTYPARPRRVAISAFAGCYVLPTSVQDELFPDSAP